VEDYARTFRVLKEIRADVFLAQHPDMYKMQEKRKNLDDEAGQNPFIDPEGYRAFVREQEGVYLDQLAEEEAAKSARN
jgi:metallo-beta-lactamase class B